MNGIINVFKEKGYTSFDVCAKLRRILKTKKIGHTGTLDPDAQGVLPVCVGNATKLCDMLTDKDKVYEAVLILGITTDTEDETGRILSTKEVTAQEEEVAKVIKGFIGPYQQIPPMYSAIKVNGQRLYELARQGKVIERKSRLVTIHAIDILDVTRDQNSLAVKEVRMRVSCSKGTYIRTLCKDIGEKLHVGGCMKSLLRTQVSVFQLEHSLKLDKIQELMENNQVEQFMIPVDTCFWHLPKAMIQKEDEKYLYNGNILSLPQLQIDGIKELEGKEQIRVYDSQNTFTGIYEYSIAKQCFQPVKMFLK